jgi:hypothetical protein
VALWCFDRYKIDYTIDEASQVIADEPKAAIAMFSGKEFA